MVHDLLRYGMGAADDEDLRFYFERRHEPSYLSDRLRWSRVRRLVVSWSAGVDLEEKLDSFYLEGLERYACDSTTASSEYAHTHPRNLPAPHGGAAYREWVETERLKETFLQWLCRLYAREAEGSTSGQDQVLLRQIADEMAPKLENLVQRYERRKADVMGEIAREEREDKEEDRPLRGED
jgi:hypothetical protein